MRRVTSIFLDFFNSEKAGGFVLIGCTIISMVIANSHWGESYIHFIHSRLDLSFWNIELDYSVEHWINDGLMTIFFLLVGLEIERELYVGELSNIKNALLPILAAVGGMAVPALIHFALNQGTETARGLGIPMATDIAFALGILSLAGNRIPLSLKIFLTALAIMDDLGAIAVIGIFYTEGFSLYYFGAALLLFLLIYISGRIRIFPVPIYLAAGVVLWYFMLKSGVHASIAGVLLAFAIPFQREKDGGLSNRFQQFLHKPVAFTILPIFALANTGIVIPPHWFSGLGSANSLGIIVGLVIGKFIGILLACWLAVKLRIAALPEDLDMGWLAGAAALGGIGFTMSVFIANLAFHKEEYVVGSKISILIASLIAALFGLALLLRQTRRQIQPSVTD